MVRLVGVPVSNSVVICSIAAGLVLLLFVVWKGSPFHFAGLDLNPRTDVVEVTGQYAQLVKGDASQRTILLVPRDGTTGRPRFSACSEPPPDIAQNLIQSMTASLDAVAKSGDKLDGNAAVKMASDLKTTVEQLFQRSQGIQLLRDTMFRLCEALQNGVIEKDDYRALIQSLITTANFIIPFEQCTGMARANQAQLPKDTVQNLLESCLNTAMRFTETLQVSEDRKIKRSPEPQAPPAPSVSTQQTPGLSAQTSPAQ